MTSYTRPWPSEPAATAAASAAHADDRLSAWVSRGGLLLLCLLYTALIAVYAWLVPPLEGFDATAHFNAVLYWREHWQPPYLDDPTARQSYELITQPPLYHVLAASTLAPFGVEGVPEFVVASQNPYHTKVLSERQTITVPGTPWATVLPVWLARAVAALGGLVALIAAWRLVRSLVPAAPTLALAVAAVVAFNPVFLFSAVTVNNDVWASAAFAGAVAAAAIFSGRRLPPRWALWIGVWVGLAALAKYSAFLLGPPLLLLWLLYARHTAWAAAWRALGWGLLGLLLIAGAWYGRNLWLYGEIIPLRQMAAAIPALNRPVPFTLDRTLDYVPWLIASYWGVFVSTIAPGDYLDTTRTFMTIGLLGLPILLVRAWLQRRRDLLFSLALALVWAIPVALAVLHWTRTVAYGEQGRLAFIAAPALALLFVLGWQAFFPTAWQPSVHTLLAVFVLGLALWQTQTLQAAYAIPPSLAQPPSPDRTLAAHFATGIQLLGVDFPEGAALEPGRPLPITLYFTTDRPIAEDDTLFLHLADQDDNLLYHYDGVPAHGRHPTRQWVPGAVFAERYEITVDEIPADGLAELSLGFYPYQDPSSRLAVRDAAGNPIGDRVILGDVRLHAAPVTPAPAGGDAPAQWSNGIALAEAHIDYTDEGEPQRVEVTWQPEATLQSDYTVFLQVLDAQNNVLAQVDQPPQGGAYPTSTWRAGDRITDTLALPLPDGAQALPWARVILGLYDNQGQRLPLSAPTPGQDYVVLATREP